MERAYYAGTIAAFLDAKPAEILGELTDKSRFDVQTTQVEAWREQIRILQDLLPTYRGRGRLYFEYSIPRLGKRIDVLAVIERAIFVLEFKVGECEFTTSAVDQVWDYALDLKNFHETSHEQLVVPILIATQADDAPLHIEMAPHNDRSLLPLKTNTRTLSRAIEKVLEGAQGPMIDAIHWETGRYSPTPTIVEAALALYRDHSVSEISRSDAGAINLRQTSVAISEIVLDAKTHGRKSICFLTGVPGAGKTLVGLNVATKNMDKKNELYSVFLSGNGPLVRILREALARDKVMRARELGVKMTKSEAMREVEAFVQNVHEFRDECLRDADRPPIEHVALFDEAQRAWNLEQTANFMKRKRNRPNFSQSEPEFLISCMNRHRDWAVIVCLVGGGQEINTGEAGISEWIDSLKRSFPDWHVFISPRLSDSEYAAGEALKQLGTLPHVEQREALHLSVSMRSFRAEHVSDLFKQVLDLKKEAAKSVLRQVANRYPMVLTRHVDRAKAWLREKARGSERYGIVVSSQAERLKPHAIDVKSPMDPVHWFLDGKEDVRSSYYLEDVATEFDVQGLELDWTCVTWDGDFRYSPDGWEFRSFCGDRWNRIRKLDKQVYLKNAYRVLLTRARQGMVIVVPQGDCGDPTRRSEFYDPTFEYLCEIGFAVI